MFCVICQDTIDPQEADQPSSGRPHVQNMDNKLREQMEHSFPQYVPDRPVPRAGEVMRSPIWSVPVGTPSMFYEKDQGVKDAYPIVTRCGHIFHKGCLVRWLTQNQNSDDDSSDEEFAHRAPFYPEKCPTCSRSLCLKEFIRIYPAQGPSGGGPSSNSTMASTAGGASGADQARGAPGAASKEKWVDQREFAQFLAQAINTTRTRTNAEQERRILTLERREEAHKEEKRSLETRIGELEGKVTQLLQIQGASTSGPPNPHGHGCRGGQGPSAVAEGFGYIRGTVSGAGRPTVEAILPPGNGHPFRGNFTAAADRAFNFRAERFEDERLRNLNTSTMLSPILSPNLIQTWYTDVLDGFQKDDPVVWINCPDPAGAQLGQIKWLGTINGVKHAGIHFNHPIGQTDYCLGLKKLFTGRAGCGAVVPLTELAQGYSAARMTTANGSVPGASMNPPPEASSQATSSGSGLGPFLPGLTRPNRRGHGHHHHHNGPFMGFQKRGPL